MTQKDNWTSAALKQAQFAIVIHTELLKPNWGTYAMFDDKDGNEFALKGNDEETT